MGGGVHTFLGNHKSIATAGRLDDTSGDLRYAKWICSRNSIVQIGDTWFVPSGLGDWLLWANINTVSRRVVAHITGSDISQTTGSHSCTTVPEFFERIVSKI